MHFYSLSYEAAMNLPIKAFWMMNQNIDRILAQRDMRSLTVAVCGQGGEATQEFRKSLTLEVGTVVKLEEEHPMLDATRDEEGFQALKELAKLI